MPNGITDPFAALGALIQQAASFVKDLIAALGERLAVILKGVIGNLSDTLADMASFLAAVVRTVEDTLDTILHNITVALGGIATFIQQIPQRLGDFAQSVVAELGKLPDDTFGSLGKWIGENWPKLLEWTQTFLPPLAHFFTSEAERAIAAEMPGLLATFEASPSLPPELRALSQEARRGGAPAGILFLIGLVAAGVTTIAQATFRPVEVAVEQDNFDNRPTRFPPAPALVALRNRELIPEEAFHNLIRKQGFSAPVADYMAAAAREHLPPGAYLEAERRGAMPADAPEEPLTLTGLNAVDRAIARKLQFVLPPVTDVLRFLMRDNFIPEIVEQFGMKREFEQSWEVGQQFFLQDGISKELALEYWKAHWDLPSITQFFQMFFRTAQEDTPGTEGFPSTSKGQHFIDEPTLRRGLRAQGVEPFWRDKLIAIAFNPLTRVDVRRMHRLGVLSPEEVKDAYLNLGYNEVNATRLRDFVLKLNGADEQAQIRALRSPVAGRVLNTYRKHYLSREDADAHLKALDYTDAARAELLATADLDIAEAYATAAESAWRAGYVSGVRNPDDTRSGLSAAGFAAATIDRLLAVWDVSRVNRELSVEEKQHRELTRAEIVEAYNDHIVTRDQAGAMLVHAGFDVPAAEQLLAIADVRVKRAEQKDLESGIHGRYVAGKITAGQAIGELDALGVRPARRVALLSTWDLEIARRESRIPVATVQDMVGKKIMTTADARKELRASGLGDKEIGWYFQLWGVVEAPKVPGEG